MCGGKRKYKKRRCQCTVPPILPARGRVLPFCQASDCHIVKSGSQIAWCLEALYDEYITIFVCRRAWLQLERPWHRNLKTELINVAVSGVVADKSVAYLFFLSATVRLSILDRCDGYGASVTDDVLPRAAFFFFENGSQEWSDSNSSAKFNFEPSGEFTPKSSGVTQQATEQCQILWTPI